jgi:hypothetical protein
MKKLPTVNDLEKILGSKEHVLFFLTWLRNDRNATAAYKELHPECAESTAQVNGSRMLSKIPLKLVAEAYGLGQEKYFSVLRNAMDATKWNDFTGEREPDFKTIALYHNKLGKLLGIENDTSVQISGEKVLVIPSELLDKYGIAPDNPTRITETSSN